jgi:hypothetical protein
MDLEKTQTFDHRSGMLKSFLRENPDLCLVNVDKSISVCFMNRTEYHTKLSELFENDPNFEPVTNYNHEQELTNHNKLVLETLGRCLNKKNFKVFRSTTFYKLCLWFDENAQRKKQICGQLLRVIIRWFIMP